MTITKSSHVVVSDEGSQDDYTDDVEGGRNHEDEAPMPVGSGGGFFDAG